MRIRDIVTQGHGKAGSNGSWQVATRIEDGNLELWHYSHRMLVWNPDNPNDEDVLDYSVGWGSVSDQGGMNDAFRALGIHRYFRRQGGAEIIETKSWYSHV